MDEVGTGLCQLLSSGSIDVQTWGWVIIAIAVVVALVPAWCLWFLLTKPFPNGVALCLFAAVSVVLVTGIGLLGYSLPARRAVAH